MLSMRWSKDLETNKLLSSYKKLLKPFLHSSDAKTLTILVNTFGPEHKPFGRTLYLYKQSCQINLKYFRQLGAISTEQSAFSKSMRQNNSLFI